ncbi:uncharacterized protein LOC130725492 [Lotus japonicus]|uniref:uncharacterized protein LOC130725492 n=1 Tax=Lotus japonicus TaxID=34305 RepID=UPI00258D1073|nr:uncharacterized protein LOC130725492 [Lotus japonicus]
MGEGTVITIDETETTIDIMSDLLIGQGHDPLLELVNFGYPDLLANLENDSYFQERAILAPTLESVEQVNNYMLSKLLGAEREYLSYDTPCRSDEDSQVDAEWFTYEFLIDVQRSGIPNHSLILKVGVPTMLLRNIDQATGLCNGTRLRVTHLTQYIIVGTVLSGIRMGKTEYIPRITLTPFDSGLPFKFSRRQFLVTLCFAMTINKSKGQSLSHVGLSLLRHVFTHGQLAKKSWVLGKVLGLEYEGSDEEAIQGLGSAEKEGWKRHEEEELEEGMNVSLHLLQITQICLSQFLCWPDGDEGGEKMVLSSSTLG